VAIHRGNSQNTGRHVFIQPRNKLAKIYLGQNALANQAAKLECTSTKANREMKKRLSGWLNKASTVAEHCS
jgi:hypothetical protein